MRSRIRRSLVLSTLVALVLGVSGAAALISDGKPPHTKVSGIDVDAKTIPQLQKLMDSRRLNSVELTNFYLRRIEKLNPTLNAVITVSPTALAEARAADQARRKGDNRPLLGIPIIVKDNVNTTGMPTTAGSWALAGSTPADAFIAGRLKAAGAIIIGKANLSEWANFRSGPSSSGWSGIGGQTNMPYVLDRNPCGSSSGSGVVAAADLAVAAVGTETDGSIVCPSGANGVVGIKPTLGLWSRAGVVPISADQDTAGPMARNVTDAAVLLGAATGVDPKDAATAAQVGHASTDYTRFLDDKALEGRPHRRLARRHLRPGAGGPGRRADPRRRDRRPRGRGCDRDRRDRHRPVGDRRRVPGAPVRVQDGHRDLSQDVRPRDEPETGQPYPQTLAELIEFNEDHPDLEGPWNNLVFELAEATNGRDPECAGIRAGVTPPVQDAIDDLMAEHDLDAIIALTNGPAWPTNYDPDEGDLDGHFEYFVGSSAAAAVSGYADITVPAGHIRKLPIGITFIGGRWYEPKLLGLAYDYEQATDHRRPPQFKATIGDALFPGVPNPPGVAAAAGDAR